METSSPSLPFEHPSDVGIVRRRSLSPSILADRSQKQMVMENPTTMRRNRGVSASPSRLSNSRLPISPSIFKNGRSSLSPSRPLLAQIQNSPVHRVLSESGGVSNEGALPLEEKIRNGRNSSHDSPLGLRHRTSQLTMGPHMPPAYPQLGWNRNPYANVTDENDEAEGEKVVGIVDDDINPRSPPSRQRNRVDSSPDTTSYCSTPSSPFMELIYSASASTAATPEIFRIADEENKETPVIRNTAPRCIRTVASSSPSSTLQSMTPRNQQQVQAEWWVPRISTTNLASSSHHAISRSASGSSSPFSLPSMLGGPSTEDVSELDSPMLLDFPTATSTDESDIQSLSQATDINSMKTTTPRGPLMRCFAKDEEDDDDKSTGIKPVLTPTLNQIASGSALCVSQQEIAAATISQFSSYNEEYPDSEPTESYLVSGQLPTAGASSNDDVEQKSSPSNLRETFCSVIPAPDSRARESYAPNIRSSRLFFRSSIPTPSPKGENAVGADRGMKTDTNSDWYLDSGCNAEDDVEISELSSQVESCRGDLEAAVSIKSGHTGLPDDNRILGPSAVTCERAKNQHKGFLTRKSWVLMCRLGILFMLALAVVIPLVIVLLHTKRGAAIRTQNVEESTNNGTSQVPIPTSPPVTPLPTSSPTILPSAELAAVYTYGPSSTPTLTEVLTNSPTKFRVSSTPTFLPSSQPEIDATDAPVTTAIDASSPIPSLVPTLSPSPQPSTAGVSAGTLSPTIGSTLEPASVPTVAPLPLDTLPPYSAIWDEGSWTQLTFLVGPLWPMSQAGPLQLTILNSLSNAGAQAILQATVDDWQSSSSVDLVIENSMIASSTSIADCVPTTGKIRVCNGNYGVTQSKFFHQIFIAGSEILAVTIYINDDYGLQSLSTTASTRRNLCHQLGHALGVFHSSRGCMVESLDLESSMNQNDYLHPDSWNFAELDRLYGNNRGRKQRLLR